MYSHVVLLQVSEEEQAISYGCTIDPISESYCADNFVLPINILSNRYVIGTSLVNFNVMNELI